MASGKKQKTSGSLNIQANTSCSGAKRRHQKTDPLCEMNLTRQAAIQFSSTYWNDPALGKAAIHIATLFNLDVDELTECGNLSFEEAKCLARQLLKHRCR